jgi:diacylglycerol O-acyltransferase / wax synthase
MSGQRMRGADAAWLHMDEPTNPMVITTLMWSEQPFDWGLMEKVIVERLIDRYPRFRQIVSEPVIGAGAPTWRDDPLFHPARHIHQLALRAPGDRRALGAFISEVMSAPLHDDRPLWQAYFVEGYEGGSAVVTRIHHCLADGIALMRVLLSLADGLEEPGPSDGTRRSRTGALGGLAGLAARAGRAGLAGLTDPAHVLDVARHATGEAMAIGRILTLPDERGAFARSLTGVKQAAWSAPLPLPAIKAAGARHGATINDVLLTMVAGALRGHLPPEVMSVRALVPFNVRVSLEAPVPATLGNEFGMLFVDLPVGIADWDLRLAHVKRTMDELKASPEGAAGFQMLGIMGLLPLQLQRAMVARFAAKGSLVLTNVPGPRTGVAVAGTPVGGVLAWVPQSGSIGVGLSLISYDGAVTFGVAADTGVVPHPQAVVDDFAHQIALVTR